MENGAGSRIRTDDLLITNQLLYQLSYAGKKCGGKVAQSSVTHNRAATAAAWSPLAAQPFPDS